MAFGKTEWLTLAGKAERKVNKTTGEILSRRQYDKQRRGGITNEVLRKQRNPLQNMNQSELVQRYREQFKKDNGKEISVKETKQRLKGFKKRLVSKNKGLRQSAYLQLSSKADKADYYARLYKEGRES